MEAIISGVLGVLIGGFIGHRLALGRDKRIEHNSVIRPLKQKILEHIDSLKNQQNQLYINDNDISEIRCWVSDKQFNSIKLAHESYRDLYRDSGKQNGYGEVIYSSQELNDIMKLAISN